MLPVVEVVVERLATRKEQEENDGWEGYSATRRVVSNKEGKGREVAKPQRRLGEFSSGESSGS